MSGVGVVPGRVVRYVAAAVGRVRVGHFRFRSPYSAPTLRLSRFGFASYQKVIEILSFLSIFFPKEEICENYKKLNPV